MNLCGKIGLLRLSPLGEEALRALVGNQSAFEGLIVSADELGLWIESALGGAAARSSVVRVMLVKWEHMATIEVELGVETPPPRTIIGFKPSR
jgi:hypothetical protein